MRAIEDRDISNMDIELKSSPSLTYMGLRHACKYGRIECIKHIYETYANTGLGTSINQEDLDHLLLILSKHDWFDCFKYLCEKGANPLSGNEDGCFIISCIHDCPDILIYICKNYDVKIDELCCRALKYANSYGYLNMMHLLLILGSFPDTLIESYIRKTTYSPVLTLFYQYYPSINNIILDKNEINAEKKRRHKLEVKFLMPRIFDICSCFKDLSANEQLQIINYSIKWAFRISDYTKWEIITKIKHFNESKTFIVETSRISALPQ